MSLEERRQNVIVLPCGSFVNLSVKDFGLVLILMVVWIRVTTVL